MKTLGSIVGTILYGGLVNYLVWLFMYWVTPYVVCAPVWVLILLAFFSLAGLMVVNLLTMLLMPIEWMTKDCRPASYASLLILVGLALNGIDALQMPWDLDAEYSTSMIVGGVEMTIFAVLLYISLFYTTVSLFLRNGLKK